MTAASPSVDILSQRPPQFTAQLRSVIGVYPVWTGRACMRDLLGNTRLPKAYMKY